MMRRRKVRVELRALRGPFTAQTPQELYEADRAARRRHGTDPGGGRVVAVRDALGREVVER